MLEHLPYSKVFTLPLNERILIHTMLDESIQRDLAVRKIESELECESDRHFAEMVKSKVIAPSMLAPVKQKPKGRSIDPKSVGGTFRLLMIENKGKRLPLVDIHNHMREKFPNYDESHRKKLTYATAQVMNLSKNADGWMLAE